MITNPGHMKVFDSLGYVQIPNQLRTKEDKKSRKKMVMTKPTTACIM